MKKTSREEFIDWCKRERDDNLDSIKRYDGGQFKMMSGPINGPLVDITQSQRDDAQRIVDEMNDLIAKMESDNG